MSKQSSEAQESNAVSISPLAFHRKDLLGMTRTTVDRPGAMDSSRHDLP